MLLCYVLIGIMYVFAACVNVNEFLNKFYEVIFNIIISHLPPATQAKLFRLHLPRHILQLVHKKKRAWQQTRSNPTVLNIRRFKYTSSILLNTMKALSLA